MMQPSEIELGKRYKLKVTGSIPQQRLEAVKSYLTARSIRLPKDFDWAWKTPKGKLTKRIERYIVNETEEPMTRDIATYLMEVGNMVSNCLPPDENVEFQFTDTFDWKNGDFGDPGSCFWGGSVASRGVLQDNGARAVQFFKEGKGFARAWLAPYKDWFFAFNGYGMTAEQIATVLKEFFTGTEIFQVSLQVGVHMNGEGAFYIAPEAPKTREVKLGWKPKYECKHCHEILEEIDDSKNMGFNEKTLRNFGICKSCRKSIIICGNCQHTCKAPELVAETLEIMDKEKKVVILSVASLRCPKCKSVLFSKCHECGEVLDEKETIWRMIKGQEWSFCKKHA
jgi:hypothetical protein